MRTAIISDVHGNLEALEAVLRRIEQEHVDEVVCLGDTVGYGPDPNACCELIRRTCSTVILGNHDEWAIQLPDHANVAEAVWYSILWTERTLEEKHKEWFSGLPLIRHQDKRIYVHAAPLNPGQWAYILDAQSAAKYFHVIGEATCFVGHSHVQGEYYSVDQLPEAAGKVTETPACIVNVGSVGQPRDGNPDACFCIADDANPAKERHQCIRVGYDIPKVAQKILEAGLPDFFAYRLSKGR